ncbi:PadR family transcriptional regulator [Hassallia byssoidea VB512170]|uniref:PadR family transcriptional regulator n=1 Tax=Hassallia byssoidea VB512170 TaxID=1304833 RepID=A0A846HKI2_9CYAN|nr:PadR family transcriptional regulator [Hassalia byssoidea]NEU77014.1 PadR family transcriptional regulator [Hassalia byssoidea VB512170]
MTSILGYALLGLLAREPCSGYDLSRKMQKPISFFWRARHSQIYPELAKLEAQSLVTYTVVEQQDQPDKKVYTITSAGEDALRKWVSTPMDVSMLRDELILRAYSLWLASPDEARQLFLTHAQLHSEQLNMYEAVLQEMLAESHIQQVDSPQFGSYAVLMLGIGYERMYSEWCYWVAQQLEHGVTK